MDKLLRSAHITTNGPGADNTEPVLTALTETPARGLGFTMPDFEQPSSKAENIALHLRDKKVSKSLRFEVFKRDSFTCQYCGAQPPDTVLECDHITPLAKGGKSSIENLITACEACNRGKSDRALGSVIRRPDADILYLQTQQEIAELRRYQAAAAERAALLAAVRETIQERAWLLTANDWAPDDALLSQMLDRYSPEVVDEAVSIVGKKWDDGTIKKSPNSWVSYLWGVAKMIDKRLEGEG